MITASLSVGRPSTRSYALKRVLAERLGHSKPSMSLDVYSHTLDPGEISADELRARVG